MCLRRSGRGCVWGSELVREGTGIQDKYERVVLRETLLLGWMFCVEDFGKCVGDHTVNREIAKGHLRKETSSMLDQFRELDWVFLEFVCLYGYFPMQT